MAPTKYQQSSKNQNFHPSPHWMKLLEDKYNRLHARVVRQGAQLSATLRNHRNAFRFGSNHNLSSNNKNSNDNIIGGVGGDLDSKNENNNLEDYDVDDDFEIDCENDEDIEYDDEGDGHEDKDSDYVKAGGNNHQKNRFCRIVNPMHEVNQKSPAINWGLRNALINSTGVKQCKSQKNDLSTCRKSNLRNEVNDGQSTRYVIGGDKARVHNNAFENNLVINPSSAVIGNQQGIINSRDSNNYHCRQQNIGERAKREGELGNEETCNLLIGDQVIDIDNCRALRNLNINGFLNVCSKCVSNTLITNNEIIGKRRAKTANCYEDIRSRQSGITNTKTDLCAKPCDFHNDVADQRSAVDLRHQIESDHSRNCSPYALGSSGFNCNINVIKCCDICGGECTNGSIQLTDTLPNTLESYSSVASGCITHSIQSGYKSKHNENEIKLRSSESITNQPSERIVDNVSTIEHNYILRKELFVNDNRKSEEKGTDLSTRHKLYSEFSIHFENDDDDFECDDISNDVAFGHIDEEDNNNELFIPKLSIYFDEDFDDDDENDEIIGNVRFAEMMDVKCLTDRGDVTSSRERRRQRAITRPVKTSVGRTNKKASKTCAIRLSTIIDTNRNRSLGNDKNSNLSEFRDVRDLKHESTISADIADVALLKKSSLGQLKVKNMNHNNNNNSSNKNVDAVYYSSNNHSTSRNKHEMHRTSLRNCDQQNGIKTDIVDHNNNKQFCRNNVNNNKNVLQSTSSTSIGSLTPEGLQAGRMRVFARMSTEARHAINETLKEMKKEEADTRLQNKNNLNPQTEELSCVEESVQTTVGNSGDSIVNNVSIATGDEPSNPKPQLTSLLQESVCPDNDNDDTIGLSDASNASSISHRVRNKRRGDVGSEIGKRNRLVPFSDVSRDSSGTKVTSLLDNSVERKHHLTRRLPQIGESADSFQGTDRFPTGYPPLPSIQTNARQNIHFRENTFEITPPDFDIRFREIITCQKGDRETPPLDIRQQSIDKCQQWLVRYTPRR